MIHSPLRIEFPILEHDSATGTWSLGDSYETIAATQVASTAGGPGTIKLLDGNSTELFTTTVTIPTLTDTMATHSGLVPNYIIDLPLLAGVEEIEFYWQGTLEATKARSANAPVVTITSPQAGSPLTSTTHVVWTATDADGDPMRAIVEYVYANDRVVPVAVSVTGNSAEVQTDSLPSTTSGEIRLRVTDGMNTTVASVAALSLLPNRPPSCYIVTPSSGDTFPTGAGTILYGVGQDPEDDEILDQNVRWYSSLDGFLGTGSLLEVDLSLGSHLITLEVRDTQGAVDTATASVAITP